MSINEIVMLCDKSGSMKGKEEMTIDGINTTINELKNSENNKNIKFSLKFFNSSEESKIQSVYINNISEFKLEDFNPHGSTAILDTIGNTINYYIEKKRRNEDAYNSCLIYVITDGLENSSKNYNYNTLTQFIHLGETSYNIKILYLAANQDAIFEASKLGISNNRALNFTENIASIPNVFRTVSSSAQRSFNGENLEFTNIERMQSQN